VAESRRPPSFFCKLFDISASFVQGSTESGLPPVMPGLEPGIQAAPSVIIRGRRPWIHGSSPCMTKLKPQCLFLVADYAAHDPAAPEAPSSAASDRNARAPPRRSDSGHARVCRRSARCRRRRRDPKHYPPRGLGAVLRCESQGERGVAGVGRRGETRSRSGAAAFQPQRCASRPPQAATQSGARSSSAAAGAPARRT